MIYKNNEHEQFTIEPPHRVFYTLSIGFCTESATRSIDSVANVIAHLESATVDDPYADIDTHSVLNELQNIIVQGAAISRYFWPIGKSYTARGEELRRQYAITDDSPLRSRELRNSIEHFDEKLDEYLKSGIVGNIIPNYFGPEGRTNGVPHHFFRAYFTNTGVFELLGKRYEVEPIASELWRLHEYSK